MLAIRYQRTGRRGHAHFRIIVQDKRYTPTSGVVVALLGNYNPHTKAAVVDKDKAIFYLNNGAQPSNRVAKIFKEQDIKLPKWVKPEINKKRTARNPDKLRRNRPAGAAPVVKPEPTSEAIAPAETEPTAATEPAEINIEEAAVDVKPEAETPETSPAPDTEVK